MTERQTAEIAAAGDHLQQIDEFLDRDPRAFDEPAQGSPVKLFMIGDGKMAAIGPIVDHMAAGLVMKKKIDLLEGFGCFPAGDDGKGRHQAAISMKRTSGGEMGLFISRRTSRMPSIASLMFCKASSFVLP